MDRRAVRFSLTAQRVIVTGTDDPMMFGDGPVYHSDFIIELNKLDEPKEFADSIVVQALNAIRKKLGEIGEGGDSLGKKASMDGGSYKA